MDITTIILAGGKSSRMGSDKGLLLWNGKSFVQHLLDVSGKYSKEQLIISNSSDYEQFGLPVFRDKVLNKGPLGGIYTGLLVSKTEYNLFLSCDAPFISQQLLETLLQNFEKFEITYPVYEGKSTL